MSWSSRILHWTGNETLPELKKLYTSETKGIQTTNTIEFFPEKVEDTPTTAATDRLARATEDLFEILQATHPATPFPQQGTVINDAMEQLTKIFTPPNRNETA